MCKASVGIEATKTAKDEAQVSAKYTDGALELALPKKAATQARRITIQSVDAGTTATGFQCGASRCKRQRFVLSCVPAVSGDGIPLADGFAAGRMGEVITCPLPYP